MFLIGTGAELVWVRFTILHEYFRFTCSKGSSVTFSVSLVYSFLVLLPSMSPENGALYGSGGYA